jgi:hypothetical protein
MVQAPIVIMVDFGAFAEAPALERPVDDRADLRQGLLALLGYSPAPDNPADEDIREDLSYNFPV